jgi:xylan 1,4-beta-xylosidase
MKRRHFIKHTSTTALGATFLPSILRGGNSVELLESFQLSKSFTAIDLSSKGQPFDHFWSKCVGAGRANEGLRADWLEHLSLAKQHCGFKYCRFHGLFHDDMFVYKEVKNKVQYNWQYIDILFDRMLDIGVRPFVELGFMPKDLASKDDVQFWWKTSVSPPKDYQKWADLVSAFTKHCIERYGLEEVRQWYFEVWNEPNLKGFWNGTKAQYFELYKVSANAIKAIDNQLLVGGPSTSNYVPDARFEGEVEDKTNHKTLTTKDINNLEWRGVWIKDFLQYCEKEKLPVDFVSTHPYPTDWALDPMTGKGGGVFREVNATRKDLEWLNKTIAESTYPKAKIHLTEWSSSPSSRDNTHDSLQAATYVIKANVDCIGLTNSMSYWTFTDVFEEKGAGDTLWHGGFGMINLQGIVKPTFHAYRFLHQLGDEILQKEEGLIVTKHTKTGKITALIYHYPPEYKDVVNGNVEAVLKTGTPRKFSFDLSNLSKKATFQVETLDVDNGFAMTAWRKMGTPQYPSREQTKQLRMSAMATKKETLTADNKGKFAFEKTVTSWTCVLIQQL